MLQHSTMKFELSSNVTFMHAGSYCALHQCTRPVAKICNYSNAYAQKENELCIL
jgi:hypothetical protein